MTARFEHAAGQRRGRRLALRTRDRDDSPAKPSRRQLQFTHHRYTRVPCRFDERMSIRNARARDDQISAEQGRGDVTTELEFNTGLAEAILLIQMRAH